MFIEEILKVDTLTFKDQSDLKRAKYEKLKIFHDGWQNIVLPAPPKNSSSQAKNELEEIKKEYDGQSKQDKIDYINCDKDASYYIKEVLLDNNYDFDEDTIEMIESQCTPIIRHYKNHFNRPRPYQLAEALRIDFKRYETDTASTPSYPSGHTVRPYVVANYYGKLYPEIRSELREAADICAFGRVIAGLHFPSDYRAGIMLADQLAEFIKYEDLREDAPVNSTGAAVATDQPLVRSRSKYVKKNRKDSETLYRKLRTYL